MECAHVPAGAGLPATYVPAWIVSQPKEGAQSRPSAEADYHTYPCGPTGPTVPATLLHHPEGRKGAAR